MKKFIKKSGIISVKAVCNDCGANWSAGAVALDAIRHHDNTGHHVYVEQTIWWSRSAKPAMKKPAT